MTPRPIARGLGIALATLALTVGVGVSEAAADGFNQKVTCKKGQVRSKAYGKGTVKMHVYEKNKDWGKITKQALYKSGPLKGTTQYWYGTWHHGKTAKKGWVKLVCADPRA